MAITSVGYEGSISEPQWARLAAHLGVEHTIVTGLQPSVAPTGDRTVRIAAGVGTGWGVADVSDATVDLAAATVATGSRWDTIAIRRTWKAGLVPGVTTIVLLQGTATKALAAGVTVNPGVVADQPLCLIRVSAGLAPIQEILDLRVWANPPIFRPGDTVLPTPTSMPYGTPVAQIIGNGGLDLAFRTGAVGAETWSRLLGPTWVNLALTTGIIPAASTQTTTPRYCLAGGRVRLEGGISRSAGTFAAGSTTQFSALPAGLAPDRLLVMPCTRTASVSLDARITVGSDGILTVTPSEACQIIKFDGTEWFPA